MDIIDKFGQNLKVKADMLYLQSYSGSTVTKQISLSKIKYVVLTHLYTWSNYASGNSVSINDDKYKMVFTPDTSTEKFEVHGIEYKVTVTDNLLQIQLLGSSNTTRYLTINYEIYYEE